MNERKLSPDRHMRLLALRYLSGTAVIRDSLETIKNSPVILAERCREFDFALNRLSYYLSDPKMLKNANSFSNVFALRQKMKGSEWLSGIGEISNIYFRYSNMPDFATTLSSAEQTFRDVSALIASGEWGYVNSLTDPGVVASALLIEGYGIFLERTENKDGLRPLFVRAFEEVLGSEYPQSKLWINVRPWVIEESEQFSSNFISTIKQQS